MAGQAGNTLLSMYVVVSVGSDFHPSSVKKRKNTDAERAAYGVSESGWMDGCNLFSWFIKYIRFSFYG